MVAKMVTVTITVLSLTNTHTHTLWWEEGRGGDAMDGMRKMLKQVQGNLSNTNNKPEYLYMYRYRKLTA